MSLQLALAFAAATLGLFCIPGPAMSVILAAGASRGFRGGLATVAGNVFGFALMLAIVLGGLQWIVSSFATWFPAVRLVGAAYLAFMGVQSLIAARREWGKPPVKTYVSTGGAFRDGLIVAFANPAVIAFLAAYLPQFIDPARQALPQFLTLAGVFLVIAFAFGSLLAAVADTAGRFLLGNNRAVIDAIAGTVLLAGGILLMLAHG